jgi:hypothetical protein
VPYFHLCRNFKFLPSGWSRLTPDPPPSHTTTTTVDGGWVLTTGLYSTTYDLQFHPIPPLSSPKLTLLRWGGRGAPPDPPSRHTITTTVCGGWFLTMALYSTTYDLQFYPIPPLCGPKLTLLRWGGRGAPPDPPIEPCKHNYYRWRVSCGHRAVFYYL